MLFGKTTQQLQIIMAYLIGCQKEAKFDIQLVDRATSSRSAYSNQQQEKLTTE